MDHTPTEQRLMDFMAGLEIIDCHEHLPPESERLASPQDVFTLVSHYIRHDLHSAGMDADQADTAPFSPDRPVLQSLFDYDIPLEKRWRTLRPYWERVRHGSYARAARLTARMVYGVDDINDDTYQELSARIAAENTPGIYKRMLCDRCKIRKALTQCGRTDVGEPLVPLMPGREAMGVRTHGDLETLCGDEAGGVKSLDDFVAFLRRRVEGWVEEGTVGIKIMATANVEPDRKAAEQAFGRLMAGQELPADGGQVEPFANFILHEMIDIATDLDLVVAVHAGIWGDFRHLDCKDMLTLAPVHPRARFDLYHLGMPFVRDAIVVAKNLPNVYLNLCWTHIISQVQTRSGVDELLDQVPVNKVLAFGGDYNRPVEKVVGHLHMAHEDYARVFGARIDRGEMDHAAAESILRQWFWDNPLALYTRLKA